MARAMSVCSTPSCPQLVEGSGRCTKCKAEAEKKRGTASQRGYDSSWRRVRAAYLKANPFCECEECSALLISQRPFATDVDHIDGLGPNGPLGRDWSNLRALSHSHHARRTARDQPGGWAANR
jgi:5-methylcytosine-specific restriction protein A